MENQTHTGAALLQPRLVRLNGCRITKDVVTYHCRWKTGFKNHCLIMIRGWSLGTTWATSGNAEVALDPADFCVSKPNAKQNEIRTTK
jgi:hypothetical protein